jgi:dihydrodipicolinate reductase
MRKKLCVYIHGKGSLGSSIMKVLDNSGYDISSDNCENSNISCIVICTPGEAIAKQIDYFLSLKIPLIILSTKYDQSMVKEKAINSGVPLIMSENMALPVLDFWDRLYNLPTVPKGLDVNISAIESHQSSKQDISGSLKNTLMLFKNLGFKFKFNYEKASKIYKVGENGKFGNVVWIREKDTQLKHEVPNQFIGSHGYHTFCINYGFNNDSQKYILQIYRILKTLETYTLPGIIDLKISLCVNNKELTITHNINGKEIYAYGTIKCIEFLKIKKSGVFSAIDVIKSDD